MPELVTSGWSANGHPVVLFDGMCGLCNRMVDLALALDSRRTLRFAPLESVPGQRLLAHHRIASDYRGSIVFVSGGRCYRRSRAVLEIVRLLPMPWPLLWGFVLVPAAIRDFLYDVVATHRYGIFGRRDACRLPTADERTRFLT